MPLKVGELFATMRLDAKEFNKGMSDARRSFDGLKSTIGSGVQAIGKTMVGITTVGVGLGAAVFKIGADYNRLQQSSRAALTTLLGSAEAANAQMDKLDDFAKNSPFAKQVFITAQQQLLGFGLEAEKVLPLLDGIQNAVAAVGGSNEQISSVTLALAQMQGQGKLTGETISQLSQYGIDAATILGQEWGKTGAEIRDMASKPGGIPADQVFAPLTDGLMKRFGGATDNIKMQMDGALDRIKAATRDIGSHLAAPFIDPKGGGIGVDWVNQIANSLHAIKDHMQPLVSLMVDRFTPAIERVSPALDRITEAIKAWDISKVNGQIDQLSKFAPLLAPVAAGLMAIGGGAVTGPLGMLVPTINPIVAALAALVAVSPDARAAFGDFASAAAPLLPIMAGLGAAFAERLVPMVEAIIPLVGNLLVAFTDVAVGLAGALVPALDATLQIADPLISVVSGLTGWMSGLPTPILQVVAALVALKALGMASVVTGISTAFKNFGTALKSTTAFRAYNSGLSATSAAMAQAGVATTALRSKMTALGTFMKTNAIGLAITGVATAVGMLMGSNQKARQAQEEHNAAVAQFADVLRESNGVIDENVYNTRLQEIVTSGYAADLEKAGISVADFTEASLGNAEAQQRVAEQLMASMEAGDASMKAFKRVSEELESYTKITEDAAEQNRIMEESQKDTADATDDLTDSLAANTYELELNAKTKSDLADEAISLRQAQIRAADSADKLAEEVKDLDGVTRDASGAVDLNAESTRRADEVLINFTNDQRSLISTMEEQGATSEELDIALESMRQSFLDGAAAVGYTREEAEDLIKTYDLFPDRVETQVWADLQSAGLAMNTFFNTWNGKKIAMSVSTTTPGHIDFGGRGASGYSNVRKDGAVVDYFANGGVRENHIAQIAPAGSWRVWAEPETGGEAYIPLALSKRARSLQILDETARRLGRITLPARSQQFASGAVASSSSISVGPQGGDFFSDALIDKLATAIGSRVFEGTRAGLSDSHHQIQTALRQGV